jgi:DNA polymerase III epsilon subunit-like protein
MKITFLDLETTSKNPNSAEILTVFLRTRRLNDFSIINESYLTFRPEKYLHDSYSIHKLSIEDCDTFDDKWDSFRKLLQYLSKYGDGLFCCHANHLVFGTYGYFDKQVIEQVAFARSSQFQDQTYYWLLQKQLKWISTHTIAKNLRIPSENYKLKTLYKYLFDDDFNHHNAKEDVEATERIFDNLITSKELWSKEALFNIGNFNGSYKRTGNQSRTELGI